jgi:pimeloyl-ACP methyl ester carboxylesterase
VRPDHSVSRSERIPVGAIHYNVRHWGPPGAPLLFLLHGWMDSSPTFQFVVEALGGEWHVIAPDWRGYGASTWLGRPYWFADYYADLDALLHHYSSVAPARLVGHSMGASIAAAYAGARPERVSGLVMLDFLGLPEAGPDEAPTRLRHWLETLDDPPALRSYADCGELARRLRYSNPRLSAERAEFLARECGCVTPEGRVVLACDPWHRHPAPVPYQVADAMACWCAIMAPVRLLVAEQGYVTERFADNAADLARRLACFSRLSREDIADCGHNLHHDQPERVAAAIENFFLLADRV